MPESLLSKRVNRSRWLRGNGAMGEVGRLLRRSKSNVKGSSGEGH